MAEAKQPREKHRILLVEDDLDQAHLLKFLLENQGDCSVTLAQDGLRGSALVEERDWDLVITDLNLPGADGMAVVEASRRHHPDTPVLATTGYSGPEYAERARESGADDVLLKPLDRDDLLTRVTLLLGREPPEPDVPEEGAPPRAEPSATAGAPSAPAPSTEPTTTTASDPGPRRVLAISVRPGDAEAGCGGTLIRHRKRGEHVVLLTLTHGGTDETGNARREQAKEAGRKMGLRFFVGNAGSGDDSLEDDLRRLVRGALEEVRPHVLYLPTRHHTDDSLGVVHDTAARFEPGPDTILAYDPGDADPRFAPDLFVPVDDALDDKAGALRSFEAGGGSHLDPDRALTSSRFWSRHAGGRPAEPLERVRGEAPDFLFDTGRETDGKNP